MARAASVPKHGNNDSAQQCCAPDQKHLVGWI